jgi:hypothetical protein
MASAVKILCNILLFHISFDFIGNADINSAGVE